MSGIRGDRRYPVKAVHADDLTGPLGATFLCVKGHFTKPAIEQYGPMLSDDGFVLSLQNGLNEAIISEQIGEDRTVGCFVHFGADYLEPGHILLGNDQTIYPGELTGQITPRVEAIRTALSNVMPAEVTTNIWGYLWGKLVYGAMAFVVSAVDAPVPDVLDNDLGRMLAARASQEAYLVGVSQTPHLESIGEFDPTAFAPGDDMDERSAAELEKMATSMRGQIKQHMGIWRDLAVKKRKTEIDMQSAVLVDYGQRNGIRTPVNAATVQVIHEIENGARGMSWDNLDAIAEIAGLDRP
ncbi:MAG: 2-dehydropantoate 2-reductase N-terminal domain-containing protein [Thermomicrobiales bacterium]